MSTALALRPTRPTATAGKTALYIYGLLNGANPAIAGSLGGASAAPRSSCCHAGPLSVLASAIAPGPVAQTRRNMIAHTALLERVIAHADVLPVRFGTVAAGCGRRSPAASPPTPPRFKPASATSTAGWSSASRPVGATAWCSPTSSPPTLTCAACATGCAAARPARPTTSGWSWAAASRPRWWGGGRRRRRRSWPNWRRWRSAWWSCARWTRT